MKQTSMFNRLLSLALCLCMVLSLLPGIPLVTANAAGTEGMITIEMTDSYGDGWNGNAIEIYVNDELLDTATIVDRVKTGTWTTKLDTHSTYTFKWVMGSFARETSFVIYAGTDQKLSDGGINYSYGATILTLEPLCQDQSFGEDYCCTNCGEACAHPVYKDSVCTACGYVCGVAAAHSWEKGVCTNCRAACAHESWDNSVCETCGFACGSDALHSLDDTHTCTVCGFVCGETAEHAWVKGICSVCSESCSHESFEDGLCTVCAYYQPAPQNGVGENGWPVYEISNASQLLWFADYVNSNVILKEEQIPDEFGYYDTVYTTTGSVNAKLMADIDLTGVQWTPIGVPYMDGNSYEAYGFSGVFEGGGHTVSGIEYSITTADRLWVGFFGSVKNCTIKDLTVMGSFYGECTTYGYTASVGGLVGLDHSGSVISNCAFIGTVSAKGESHACAGGLAACMSGTATNCFASAKVECEAKYAYCGAFAGESYGAFTNCYYDSTVCSLGAVEGAAADGVTGKATEKVANGEVAYLLGEGWGQDIGTELYPVLGGEPVYLATTGCVSYSNTQAEPTEKEHVGGVPTCTEKGICTACAESYIEPLGHEFGSDHLCIRCGVFDEPKQNGVGANGWPVYEIRDAAQLLWFAEYVNSGTVFAEETIYEEWGSYTEYVYSASVNAVLLADIDLTGMEWIPMGTRLYQFKGTFDGNGHTVSGIECSITAGEHVYAGFVGAGDGCTIENLTVMGSFYAECTNYGYTAYAGGLAGAASGDSVISNCAFIGTVSAKCTPQIQVGGLAGNMSGTATNCFVSAQVQGEADYAYCGAFVGVNYGTFTNCYYDSTVCSLGAVGAAAAAAADGVTGKATEKVANGEVAYLLGEGWGQDIGTELYPVLGGEPVYLATTGCVTYSNTQAEPTEKEHVGGVPTCTEKGICTACAEIYGEPLGHDLGSDLICTRCGEYEKPKQNGVGENGWPVYEISNASQLMWFANYVNSNEILQIKEIPGNTVSYQYITTGSVNAKLMADIDLTGIQWTPIGVPYMVGIMYETYGFSGVFEGNGHKISGVTVLVTGEFAGFFGEVGDAVIRNLAVEGSICAQLDSDRVYAGGMLACAHGAAVLENCSFVGSVNVSVSQRSVIGGLAGYLDGTVGNCFVSASVTCDYEDLTWAGAMAGSGNATFVNCYYDSTACSLGAAGNAAIDGVTAATAEQFASGEVCWLMNAAVTDTDDIWFQTIGEDANPVLSGDKVYLTTDCQDAPLYSNSEEAGQHNYTGSEPEYAWYRYEKGDCYVEAFLPCVTCGDGAAASGSAELVETVEGTDCAHPGSETYTVTLTLDGVEYTGTKTYEIKSENHVGEPVNGFCSACGGYEKPVVDPGEDPEWDYDDVYLIYNAGQLYWFADYVNNVNNGITGKLMADIDLNPGYTFNADGSYTLNGIEGPFAGGIAGLEAPRAWTPIGQGYTPYCGNFDGNGYTVSGVYCVAEYGYVGLFGYTDYNYTIENLALSNSYFQGSDSAGGLIGCAYTTVKNCLVDSTVTVVSDDYDVGGLIGYNGGEVSNCLALNGSLVGSSGYGTCTNCYFLSDTEDSYDGTTAVTAEMLASGEVAYLLQSAIVGEEIYDEATDSYITLDPELIWGQTIGEDAYPVLGGDKVYYGYKYCDVQGYTNDPKEAAEPHSFTDGVCTPCGKVCDHTDVADGVCGTCGLAMYTVTVDPNLEDGMTLVSGFVAAQGVDYTGIIERNNYYMVGSSGFIMKVYIGGELTTNYSIVNGVLTIPGEYVTGDIYITGDGVMEKVNMEDDYVYTCFHVFAGGLTPYEITWAEDCSSATVVLPCAFCEETVEKVLSSTCVTTDANCTNAGTATYTVSYRDLTASKTVETDPATGKHNIGEDGLCTDCGASESYSVWIGGQQINSVNASDVFGDGTVSYDPETYTLTLNNASIQGGVLSGIDAPVSSGIYYGEEQMLNLVLVGDNSVVGGDVEGENSTSIGIFASDLTVSGDGTLTVTKGEAVVAAGMLVYSTFTVEAGTCVTCDGIACIYGTITASGDFHAIVAKDSPAYTYEVYGDATLTEELDITSFETDDPITYTLTVMDGATLTIADGAKAILNKSNSSIINNGTILLEGTGTIVNNGSGTCLSDDSNHVWEEEYCLVCHKVREHTDEDGDSFCDNCGACMEHTYHEGYYYSDGANGHYRECDNCGELDEDSLADHVYTDDSDYYCDLCYFNRCDHGGEVNVNGALSNHTFICAACGASLGREAHTDGEDADTICDICGVDTVTITIYFDNTKSQWDTVRVWWRLPGGTVYYASYATDVDGELHTFEVPANAETVCIQNYYPGQPEDTVPGGYINLEVTPEAGKTYTYATEPAVSLQYPSLSFEGEIYYNFYFTTPGITNGEAVEYGLLLFDSELADGTIEDASNVIPGADGSSGVYRVRTDGIPAKKMGDKVYFKVYVRLPDNTYVYSKIQGYSAVDYAMDRLANSENEELKALCVALLNYGAAAQEYFGYKTDSLMNAGLTDEQKALAEPYAESMVNRVSAADAAKVGEFANNKGYSSRRPSVSFEGAFSIGYYLIPKNTPENGVTLYYWTQETYDSVDVLTRENADGVLETVNSGNTYKGVLEGIAAKAIDEPVYVAGVYEFEGVSYATGVMVYSLGEYCVDRINNGSAAMKPLAEAAAAYGYYAKTYFANISE